MTAIGFVNYTAAGEVDEKGDFIGIAATDKGDMPIIGMKIG